MPSINRRKLLKNALGGVSALAVVEAVRAEANSRNSAVSDFRPDAPVTAITLGAGARGNVYGGYALAYPNQLNIVGAAEPIAVRKERYAEAHKIPDENQFETWEDVFKRPRFAQAVIITTPDDLHHGPAMAALRLGYDILLEKPVSPTLQECLDIRDLAKKTGRIVAVCHVLRYTAYFRELKSLVDSGAIGELVSIQHFEPIQFEHMAHSFVRGNWHNSAATTPIILAKSCHDLDILRWIADRPSKKISAFGGLKWFRRENAPAGSTPRCMDGCEVERDCPYSAKKLYLEKADWSYVFDLPEDPERIEVERLLAKHPDIVLTLQQNQSYSNSVDERLARLASDLDLKRELRSIFGKRWRTRLRNYATDSSPVRLAAKQQLLATTNYGRCVYRMDNDQPDHYVANIQFRDQVTASFSMEAFTSYHGRRTRIMGSMGDIVGDMSSIRHTDFRSGKETRWDTPATASGHGGGDYGLVYDWVRAVDSGDPSKLSSTIDASIESHVMAFRAETSRLGGTVEDV